MGDVKGLMNWSTRPTHSHGRLWSLFSHMLSVRPSIRLSPQQQKTMVATGETVGLAEWIIGDTCLVFSTLSSIHSQIIAFQKWYTKLNVISWNFVVQVLWRRFKVQINQTHEKNCKKKPWNVKKLKLLNTLQR